MIEPYTDWKSALKLQCVEAIEQMPDFIEEGTLDTSEPPSLYAFYEELLTMRNEVRKVNRKTADTFSRFGDVLEGMRSDSGKLREQLATSSQAKRENSGTSRNLALSLVGLLDRVHRLETAADSHAQSGWLDRIKASGQWKQQAGAIHVLDDHLMKLLTEAGVELIEASPGMPFDPLWMKAVGKLEESATGGDSTSLVIAERILPGYRMGDQCLRPAEVRVKRTL